MSTKTTKSWQDIVESNYVTNKKSPALKTDGTPFLGKAQMYLTEGAWVDRYHAKMQGLAIDENSKRQVPKSRAGYTTLYKIKGNIPAIKKEGLKPLLKQLQLYTNKKGQGKSDSAKAENLLRSIKKELSAGEKTALNQYLNTFYAVVVATDDNVPLQEVAKAVKIGYGIMTAKEKGGK
jgi:hypothetical protein